MSSKEPDPIVGVVVALLDDDGYEAVQLREVARRARVSLATIYKRYRTRDELIVAALDWWMDAHRYAGMVPAPDPAVSMHDELVGLFRKLFAPWEEHPRMLRAYFRARSGPGGERLVEHGFDVVVPVARAILARAEESFAKDFETILSGVIYGQLSRFAAGDIEVTDILPAVERTIFWLTTAHDAVLIPRRGR